MLKIQSFDWSHSNVQIQNKLSCLPVFVANVFLKLINIFVFIVFILVDAFSSSIKTEKSQKIFFTLAENNFGERNLRVPAGTFFKTHQHFCFHCFHSKFHVKFISFCLSYQQPLLLWAYLHGEKFFHVEGSPALPCCILPSSLLLEETLLFCSLRLPFSTDIIVTGSWQKESEEWSLQ